MVTKFAGKKLAFLTNLSHCQSWKTQFGIVQTTLSPATVRLTKRTQTRPYVWQTKISVRSLTSDSRSHQPHSAQTTNSYNPKTSLWTFTHQSRRVLTHWETLEFLLKNLARANTITRRMRLCSLVSTQRSGIWTLAAHFLKGKKKYLTTLTNRSS